MSSNPRSTQMSGLPMMNKRLKSKDGVLLMNLINLHSFLMIFLETHEKIMCGETIYYAACLLSHEVTHASKGTNGKVDRRTDKQTDRRLSRWTDGWIDCWTSRRSDEGADKRTDSGQTDGRMNRQTDGQTD